MAVSAIDFKAALARWPSGVTVVTAFDAASPRAITVSAFSSVSLEPPLVVVALNTASPSLEFIKRAGVFAINILADDQAHVSHQCASSSREGMDGVRYTLGDNGCALVDGAVAHLECDLHALVPAGDHHLVVGLVTRANSTEATPLLYWSRQYGQFTSGE